MIVIKQLLLTLSSERKIHKGNTKLLLSYKRMVGESPIPKQARKEMFLIKNDSSVGISQEMRNIFCIGTIKKLEHLKDAGI
jgi:hypothetical protein